MSKARSRLARPVALLVVQNVVVFWSHYFRGYGFPWDFSQAYFGMNSFSVRALQHGLLPQWMPYQCMGYPYPLNLQSGLYYPPLWTFALLRIPYDLGAASILQCFHVLFGAVGMLVLLRRLLSSQTYAIVGALIFQFFGGFYSNAQHPDIIRSFSLAPWLFLAFTLDEGAPTDRRVRRMLLPLLVYLAATGGYAGNLISVSFVLGVYLMFQLAKRLASRRDPKEAIWAGAALVALFVLGLGMAAVQLGPAWFQRVEMARSGAQVRYMSLWFQHLPLLIFWAPTPPNDPSMTSTFLTIPGLLMVFFVSKKCLKERWIWVAILAVSVLMVAGERSILWRAMVALAEPFGLSRFPSSDYRPLVGISFIVLACLGLRSLDKGELGPWSFAVRGLLAFAAIVAAGRVLFGTWLAPPVLLGLLLALAALGVFAWISARSSGRSRGAAISCLAVLIALDALRVLPNVPTWREPEIGTRYQRRHWVTSSTPARKASMFEVFPRQRPAREETESPHWYSWAGYLEGRYMLADKAPCIVRSARSVFRNPQYKSFMSSEWTPLDFQAPRLLDGTDSLTVDEHTFEEALARAELVPPAIRQTRYGMDEISYRVSLPREALVVENEMYFPGWEAVVGLPEARRRLQAQKVNGVFRAWILPAGTYRMVARFRMPHLASYRTTSLVSLAIYLLLLGPLLYRPTRVA